MDPIYNCHVQRLLEASLELKWKGVPAKHPAKKYRLVISDDANPILVSGLQYAPILSEVAEFESVRGSDVFETHLATLGILAPGPI